MFASLKLKLGEKLASYLSHPIANYQPFSTYEIPLLEDIIQPADILLVEGNTRISTAIKYLTQSTWSHAAFYGGAATNRFTASGEALPLIEAELNHGVIASSLSKYSNFNIRICRPVGLSEHDRERVVSFMVNSLGLQYDLKHVFDLARYLISTPPVPTAYRRGMIALGSGEPSRAICSSLIAESFQSIPYPILPEIENRAEVARYHYRIKEIYHIRDHSLFTPRDFDVSPFFKIIKPTIEKGFDYRRLTFLDLTNENNDSKPSYTP